MNILAMLDVLKYISKVFLFCVVSLLQCFRVRFKEQIIIQPDLGPVRPSPLRHIVAHMLININLLTSYVSMFIRKNILNSLSRSNSSETNPW